MKNTGAVYTPKFIVDLMLDKIGYKDQNLLKKHIIDNSCGEGAFLIEIVDRYIKNYFIFNNDLKQLKKELETYIHGIEINKESFLKTLDNLNAVANKYGLLNLKWDIINDNAFKVSKFNNKIDFVVGNPPYVRIHNLNNNYQDVKLGKFSQQGMTDLYIAFYEIGLSMLNGKGKLIYINPTSLLQSKASSVLRKYIIGNNLLTDFIDLKHLQVFKNITTYTGIFLLDKNKETADVNYYEIDQKFNLNFIDKLKADLFYIDDNFYFSNKNSLIELKQILNYEPTLSNIEVKNGLATLADKIFIKEDFQFKSSNVIDVYKISRQTKFKIIFPYDKNGNLLPFDKLDLNVRKYLLKNKKALQDRSLIDNQEWYSFGRTQSIKDVNKPKIVISNLIKTSNDIKIKLIKPNVAVYSGIYIIGELNLGKIEKILLSDDFINYLKLLKKYKNGGYYTFSTKDLKKYLQFYLEKDIHD
ncbi:hypothetical protein FJO69_00425 [[Mycoplasma] falconis]|uniref:site-specific DNA-methyltransferase (adenine-specific) n=1 Tax=[Mycoplasma] falconis TaxID=92403 RepID=A0A501XBV4_9BACT|nr:hypothetical protein FJO69_00425 [[Mycoplasma] falconis]